MGDSEGQEFFRPGPAKGDELITSEDLDKLLDEFKDRKGKHTPEKFEIWGGEYFILGDISTSRTLYRNEPQYVHKLIDFEVLIIFDLLTH